MTDALALTVPAVRAEILAIAREILREPAMPIEPGDELRDQLGLDSADLAELVVALESRLGMALPDTALAPTATRDPLATVDTLAVTVVEEAAHARG